MAYIKPGDRWGALRCLDIRKEPCTVHVTSAVSSVYDELVADLACDCGRLFTVKYHSFPGKRRIRDCGCGLFPIDEPGRIVTTLAFNIEVIKLLKSYALDHGWSMSAAVAFLVRQAVRQEGPRRVTRHSLLPPPPSPEPPELPSTGTEIMDEFTEKDFR